MNSAVDQLKILPGIPERREFKGAFLRPRHATICRLAIYPVPGSQKSLGRRSRGLIRQVKMVDIVFDHSIAVEFRREGDDYFFHHRAPFNRYSLVRSFVIERD